MTEKAKRKLETIFQDNDKISQLVAASKFKCSQPYICHTLKNKTDIRSPPYTDD
jgi:hypothetical protein